MNFKFSDEELHKIIELKSKVDDERALVLPALWMVQRKNGFIDNSDVKYLEKTLGIKAIFFKEAISFFAMLNDKPKGKFELKFCRTISCKLRGSDELIELCESLLGIKLGETTKDGLFSLEETECLGYCEKAPCMLCNLEQIDTLDEDKVANLIENLRTKECK
ncbi:NADH-quinone oxidoreductase subunit NuoE family protein [Campylobacter hyointestinalis]|uniref:NAD(P)H-dependent oxidoreductase subunit E n=1 Tax=Campylobacter hyointestinalis subsp. lawsonii TaxID=91353 RepID=A0AAV6EEZ3_CAMHY|nr:NAD(P)H-dependent oxidoreductase subunit E [Campylobacter hyointestinalis]KAB0612445.1 NAD(P)H-dependent oxidoreductase subunit E [Campylobacter hyointestinalis subsp. lawsonii]QKF68897.1 NADH:quinone oxidoreductase I, chain E (thioredoxin-like [2Fe-2S] ferredoxin family) [Campylobacter hyointestinalis subsp. lawsonii]RAZ26034.1 NAD(P)H-dependent oxidoreductase subunit E [Campylobacter hyointestinalis subsp. lawsonii]RAZ29530.1 NAD(P)H-dependent oxidoreductase subunit E [Campylobacter hyoint